MEGSDPKWIRERIIEISIKNNNSEEKDQTGTIKKLERLKERFIFINGYNKVKNPNSVPELDWFKLTKKERKLIFEEDKCEFYNYPRSAYDAMTEFRNPSESQRIFQNENLNVPLHGSKIGNRINIFQSNGATESLTEMLQYFKTKYQISVLEDNDTLETPTKKGKLY